MHGLAIESCGFARLVVIVDDVGTAISQSSPSLLLLLLLLLFERETALASDDDDDDDVAAAGNVLFCNLADAEVAAATAATDRLDFLKNVDGL